ncbi:MAG TPA: trypsin-like peptidase domain-containing protein [Thermoanaerobaculia bacterium]|nr:trypsin-like peptidase domain-containing protein [Thermoanaerobaculia bacterium]
MLAPIAPPPLKRPIHPEGGLRRPSAAEVARRGGSFSLVLALAAFAFRCASAPSPQSAPVQPVEQREPVPVDGERSSPVEFRKLLLKLPRDRVVGSVQAGRACVGHAPLTWKTSPGTSVDEDLGELLLDELSSAGYTIVQDRNTLFDDPHGRKAEYVIAGGIRDVRANVCYAHASQKRATAEASLTVDWQVYSHRTKTVELKATTQGSSLMPLAQGEAGTEAISRAFVSAARNLLAESRFHDLVSGMSRDKPGKSELTPISVAYEILPARRGENVESIVSDSRMGVVTVFAGDSMGSGFLISPDGYVLTNQHVIGQARYIKVRFVTGREVNGEVVRSDRLRDVALIKLESDIYPFLPLGQSSRVRPGADVFAIGTPLAENLGQTVTKGVLSGYGEEDGLRILRSDVSVHRGNSGGPLLDSSGIVVGLSVSGFLIMPEGVGVGLNSFIPIEEALTALVIERRERK